MNSTVLGSEFRLQAVTAYTPNFRRYRASLRGFEPLTSVLCPSEGERRRSSSFAKFKSKTVRALRPTRGLAGRSACLSGTRVFARLTLADHRCFFGFQ